MKTKLAQSILFYIALLLAPFSFAQSPVTMLDDLADETLSSIKSNRDAINKDPDVLYDILRNKVLPHVDFNEMALWIAGKKAWRGASEAQRSEFIKEFKTMTLRTYSHFLLGVRDEQVSFNNAPIPDKKRVQVSGKIQRANGDVIRIDYRLVKNDGKWYIYDMVADGVSLLRGFQAQFSDMIKQGGLSKAIAELKAHNSGKKNS